MKTTAIIEGLQILEKYRDKPDGFNCGAEHDEIHAYPTDKPLSTEDLGKMIELGWLQTRPDYSTAFSASDYRVNEGWYCFT